MKSKNIPKLRFPGFQGDGEWEEKRLGNISTFSKGKSISKKDITLNGEFPCIRYGELYTLYTEVISSVISKTNIPITELVLSKRNDVIMPSSGETKIDIATASCVLLDDVALGGDIIIIRTQNNGIFLSYYLNSSLKSKIASVAQGDTVVHLYATQLADVQLFTPSLPEQQKIADCLSSLDDVIHAQAQKIEKLTAHKKGLLQKLFPQEGQSVPEFRFPEFRECGEWEKKTIGEIAEIGYGKDHKALRKGNIPLFGSGGLMKYVDSYLYDGETVFIGRKGTIDNPFYYEGKFWNVDTLFYTHSFKCLPKFLYLLFLKINWKRHSEASGIPSLSQNNIKKIKVKIPNEDEQAKIIECIFSLDSMIKFNNKKISLLINHKQGLMARLFPK